MSGSRGAVTRDPRVLAIDTLDAATTLAWIDLDAGSDHADRALLSADECARADRFAFARDRDRHVVAHTVLRRLLGERIGRPPEDLVFGEGSHGKPFLLAQPSWHFNLSHGHGVGLIGLSTALEIGVDVEVGRAVPDALAIARMNFTPAEFAAFEATDAHRRDTCFLQCWTRKEACMKAVGLGFALPPASFEVGIDADPRVVTVQVAGRPARLDLQSVARSDAMVAAVVAAVARVQR